MALGIVEKVTAKNGGAGHVHKASAWGSLHGNYLARGHKERSEA